MHRQLCITESAWCSVCALQFEVQQQGVTVPLWLWATLTKCLGRWEHPKIQSGAKGNGVFNSCLFACLVARRRGHRSTCHTHSDVLKRTCFLSSTYFHLWHVKWHYLCIIIQDVPCSRAIWHWTNHIFLPRHRPPVSNMKQFQILI